MAGVVNGPAGPDMFVDLATDLLISLPPGVAGHTDGSGMRVRLKHPA